MASESRTFALWSYDQYPYVLGGEVVAVDDEGYVQTKEYGAGVRFKPSLIVSLERGKDLMEKLSVLKEEKRSALNEVDETFRRRLTAFKKNERIEL